MEKKYAYANIRIPIELKPDGKIEPLKEYINVDFTKCEELPVKKETNTTYSSIINNLKSLFLEKTTIEEEKEENIEQEREPELEKEEKPEEEKIVVLSSEIKSNKKPKLNTSFKQKSYHSNKYTAKYREPISNNK
jgi:hypothetical protein